MKRIFTLSALFLLILNTSKAQLTIDTTISPADLVSNVLVGSGVTVSNITFNGSLVEAAHSQESCGQFGGSSSIGLSNGVLMGTGYAYAAKGPNTAGGYTLGSTTLGFGGDPDLDAIATAPINDKNIIEFDFIPQGDSIKFRYVFASEEYPEYVCSTFNDVFGFFLTGTNPAGGMYTAQNLALIPGTSLPVAINTVNPGVPGSSSGGGSCTSLSYSMYYLDNTGGTTIQYDGYTVLLEVKAAVNCGETYHIKLAIADAGDAAFDSGVFLEAGSFSSDGVTVDLITTSGTSTIMEGCLQGGTYSFTRPPSTDGDTLILTVDVSGSAINGVDYSPYIDSTIIFLPGQDSVGFSFLAIADGLTEGVDSLVITIYNINACGDTIPSTATVYISDLIPMTVSIGPDTALPCTGGPVPITAFAQNGYTPYTYTWSTGGSGPGSSTNPTITTTQDVIVIVTGPCGTSASDTMHVDVAGSIPPVWTAPVFSVICPDSVLIAPTWISGGTTPYTYAWNTGETDSSHYVNPGDTTVYNLIITDGCGNASALNITVNGSSIPHVWSSTPYSTYCPFDAVDITATHVSGGAAPFTYAWSTGSTNDSISVNPGDTTVYTLTITDVCNQVTILPVEVDVRPSTQISVNISSDTLCIQDGLITIVPTVTNSNGGTIYTWYHNLTVVSSADQFATTDLTTQTYVITVVDVCGSSDSDTSTIVVQPCDITIPNIMTPNGDGYNEYWVITNIEKHPNTAVQVYNRWGQLMYENGAYQNNWDGGDVSDGVYFYLVTLTDGSTPANFHGTVQIARGK
jgi:gliding motility-associated-like protein